MFQFKSRHETRQTLPFFPVHQQHAVIFSKIYFLAIQPILSHYNFVNGIVLMNLLSAVEQFVISLCLKQSKSNFEILTNSYTN